jgi:hypothetical protein
MALAGAALAWLPPQAAADARAEPAEAWLGLPAYPLTEPTQLPVDMQTNGVPQQTIITFTEDSVRTVLRFYREALGPRGVRLLEHVYGPGSAYIGFHDEAAQTTRLVSAMAQADGRTLLVFSAMDPRPLIDPERGLPADLPGLPEASSVTSTEETYGGTRYRTVRFMVAGTSPAAARQLLLARAQADGWRPADPNDNLTGMELHLSRGAATCMIQVDTAIDPSTGGPTTSVTLIALEPRGAP